jgi:hypothetical protein
MRNERERVARVNPLVAAKAMMGMVQEKFHAMEHRYPSRAEIVDKFGYDPKQLQHLIRMSWFLDAYICDQCWYQDILTLHYAGDNFKSWLLDVKRGREYGLEQARVVAADWLARAEHALTHAKEIYDGVENEAISAAMDEVLGEMIKRAIKEELAK